MPDGRFTKVGDESWGGAGLVAGLNKGRELWGLVGTKLYSSRFRSEKGHCFIFSILFYFHKFHEQLIIMAAYTRPNNVRISSHITCLNGLKTNKEKWQIIETYSESSCEGIFTNPTMENPEECAMSAPKWSQEEKIKAFDILKAKYQEIVVGGCEENHHSHCSFTKFCAEIMPALPTHLPHSNSFDSSRYVLWAILCVFEGKDPHGIVSSEDDNDHNNIEGDERSIKETVQEAETSDDESSHEERVERELFADISSEIWEFNPKTKPAQLLKTIFHYHCGLNNQKNVQFTRDTALAAFRVSVIMYNNIAASAPRDCNIPKTIKAIEKGSKEYKVSCIIIMGCVLIAIRHFFLYW